MLARRRHGRVGDTASSAHPRLHVDAGTQALDQFVAAIRDLLRVAERAGVTAETRRAKLRTLPAPLAGRLIATDLLAADVLDVESGLALLSEEVSASEAMPETLALLRRLRDADADGLSTAMADAVGTPPDTVVAERLDDEEQIPRRWGDVYGWSAAMPPDAIAAWQPAIDICRSRWGEPSPEGAILPPPVAVFGPDNRRTRRRNCENCRQSTRLARLARGHRIRAMISEPVDTTWRPYSSRS